MTSCREGIPYVNKQTKVSSQFDDVVEGSYGNAETKYIWTIDNNGVNLGLEQTPIGPNSVIKHSNLSSKAFSGGEVWFTGNNTVHINAWSGRYGAGANMSKADWDLSIDTWKNLGYDVKVEPYTPK